MGCDPRVIVNPSVTEVVVKNDRPLTVVETPVTKVVRPVPTSKVQRVESKTNVVVNKPTNRVVELGIPGPQGEQGPPGPAGGSTAMYPVGETIHGLRAVRAANGLIYHPDVTVVEHAKETFGVARQSASVGEVEVQLSGEMVEPSWDWDNGYVYCGQDGQLVQPAEPVGWLLAIGRAVNPTTIIIDIDTPFVRA